MRMTRTMTVSNTVVIAADPTTAYAHVSDPTRMGQSSPENLGAGVVAGVHVQLRTGQDRREVLDGGPVRLSEQRRARGELVLDRREVHRVVDVTRWVEVAAA